MSRKSLIRTFALCAALASATLVTPVGAAEDDDDHHHGHHCPAGFQEKRATTGEERAKDHNRDGVVCVRDGEVRDDVD
jgi:hypothetical protein